MTDAFPGKGDGSRGISTTLDVTLALVLLAAAVVVLAGIPADPGGRPEGDAADATAEVLATSTASVEYTLSPGARRADESLVEFPTEDGPAFDRVAHGTLARLLADAAVGNATIGNQEIGHAGDDYERAVGVATAPVASSAGTGVQVRALWCPYPGAPIGGRLVVGNAPAATTDVHAATVTTPSGMPPARNRALRAAEDRGFEGVADVVASATVDGLFPPRETSLAMRGDYPVSALARYRYRNAGRLLGVDPDVDPGASEAEIRRGNRELAAALAPRIERDMRDRYETPEAAARDVSVGTVRVTVRTWSR